MDLLLHFKVNEGDENNINIQEYMLYGDVETKSEKCLVDEGDEVVLTEFPVPECGAAMQIKNGRRGKFWGCTNFPRCHHTEDWNGD